MTWTFPSGQQIGSLRNGNVTQSDAQVTVTDMGDNSVILPGGSQRQLDHGEHRAVRRHPQQRHLRGEDRLTAGELGYRTGVISIRVTRQSGSRRSRISA
ncbi:cellulose binding domain-containing protein [Kitasatospora griseola]|uniref:cellulose binding domain-containing protein n=1 Tax=Kitasatospora griseola TaxID=2064 RepID=UPI0036D8340E